MPLILQTKGAAGAVMILALVHGQVAFASCDGDAIVDDVGNALFRSEVGQKWPTRFEAAVRVARSQDKEVRAALEAVAPLDAGSARLIEANSDPLIDTLEVTSIGADRDRSPTLLLTVGGRLCEGHAVLKLKQGKWRLITEFSHRDHSMNGYICAREGETMEVWEFGGRRIMALGVVQENYIPGGAREKRIAWGVERGYDAQEFVKRVRAREVYHLYDPLRESPEQEIGRIDMIYEWRDGSSFLKDVSVTHIDCPKAANGKGK